MTNLGVCERVPVGNGQGQSESGNPFWEGLLRGLACRCALLVVSLDVLLVHFSSGCRRQHHVFSVRVGCVAQTPSACACTARPTVRTVRTVRG